MTEPETENGNPALEEATRELQAARTTRRSPSTASPWATSTGRTPTR